MVLLDALSQVSPEHRGVVLLAVVRDRPYADVAAALDIPVGTVKSRVHHALRGMRRSLGIRVSTAPVSTGSAAIEPCWQPDRVFSNGQHMPVHQEET